jgi:ZIP family zinc transporter
MTGVWFALGLTLVAGLATGIGGLLTFLMRRPSGAVLAAILGFSAGVMIYVSLAELVPQSRSTLASALGDASGWVALASFFGGIAVAMIVDRLVPEPMNPHEVPRAPDATALHRLGLLTAIVIALHNFPEGFATFMAAIQAPEVAVPVAVAIGIHNVPEGIAVAVPIYHATGNRTRALGLAALTGVSEPVGGLLGYLLLRPFISDALLGVVFGVIAGIMVFISLDELLPTAESYGRHHLAIYGVVAGMAVMAVSLQLL